MRDDPAGPLCVTVALTGLAREGVECLEDRDRLVEASFVMMRRAEQGFFDVAMDFDQVFCSAEVDCQAEGGLLHDASGARGGVGPNQIGDETPNPVEVPGLRDVVEVGAGDATTCARRNDHDVWCWRSSNTAEGRAPKLARFQSRPGGGGAMRLAP